MRFCKFLLLLGIFFGCTKVSTNCTYSVEFLQTFADSSEGVNYIIIDTFPVSGAVGWGFYGDTTVVVPKNYDQAFSGTATNVESGAVESAAIGSTFTPSNGVLKIGEFTKEEAVLVVCDTVNKIFGYRQYSVGENIKSVDIKLIISPQTFASYPDTVIIKNGWVLQR